MDNMDKIKAIKTLSFGSRVAEDEMEELKKYFVQTDNWRRFINGDIDIVYGPKGSGKSAIYLLLLQNKADLLESKNISVLNAENLRGKTAFSEIKVDPPTTEIEFVTLWKLYFITLIGNYLGEKKIKAQFLRDLKSAGLIKDNIDLTDAFRTVAGIVKSFRTPHAVEAGTAFDPTSGRSEAFARLILDNSREKISPSAFDTILAEIQRIAENENFTFWIAIDRLDVAFSESPELEANAIRALFRVYLDLGRFTRLRLKLFVRTDIWGRVTDEGFREGSHLTRALTIDWKKEEVISLILSRAFKSKEIKAFYGIQGALDDSTPKERAKIFRLLLPDKIEGGQGAKKPDTINWIITRTQDSTHNVAPREIIHLLSEARNDIVHRVENGHRLPPRKCLLDPASFRNALPSVSKVRLEQTLYAEYPKLKGHINLLEREKCEQPLESLMSIWQMDHAAAKAKADELVSVGFFERRGEKNNPRYWVPFIYRPVLNLIQGKASSEKRPKSKKTTKKKGRISKR